MLTLGVCRMCLFLANSVPFGISLTMAVKLVEEKETAVAVLSYGQCCCQQAFYIDMCVYIKTTSSQHILLINQLQILESSGLK